MLLSTTLSTPFLSRNGDMLTFATKLHPTVANMETAWDAGYRAAEVSLNAAALRDWNASVDAVKRFPMRYTLHFPNKGPIATRKIKKIIKLYRSLQCSVMIIHPGMLQKYHAELDKKKKPLCLAVENGKVRYEAFYRWAETHNHLTLDVEHLWKYSLEDCPFPELRHEMKVFLWKYGSKVRHVHLPGYIPGQEEHQLTNKNPKLARMVLNLLELDGIPRTIVSEARTSLRTPENLAADSRFFENWSRFRAPQRFLTKHLAPRKTG
ncbi:MAG: hypothetical protein AAGD22_00695 [Verrucomicrobiota bacterium]